MLLRELGKAPDVLCVMAEWLIYEVKLLILADSNFLKYQPDHSWKKL